MYSLGGWGSRGCQGLCLAVYLNSKLQVTKSFSIVLVFCLCYWNVPQDWGLRAVICDLCNARDQDPIPGLLGCGQDFCRAPSLSGNPRGEFTPLPFPVAMAHSPPWFPDPFLCLQSRQCPTILKFSTVASLSDSRQCQSLSCTLESLGIPLGWAQWSRMVSL